MDKIRKNRSKLFKQVRREKLETIRMVMEMNAEGKKEEEDQKISGLVQ